MGRRSVNMEERNIRLFNSPLEIGLRCLFLLNQFSNYSLTIDKLIYFDYFLIHSGDIAKKQKSLHPKYPFRSSEIVVKRELIIKSIKLLVSKDLILINFTPGGIEYRITDIGVKAVDYFESNYADQLKKISVWVYENYKDFSEESLSVLINSNIQKWGSEFSNESKFRGIK